MKCILDVLILKSYLKKKVLTISRFLNQSKEECEYLISLAKPHMAKSTVVDSATGRSKDSRYAFLTPPYISCGHNMLFFFL